MQNDDNQRPTDGQKPTEGMSTGNNQQHPTAQNDQQSKNRQEPILPATNQQIAQNPPEPAATDLPKLNIEPPQEASDSDIIEKEWVEKAKQIVDETRDNPYQQQEELSKMKKEYLKKRYNRDADSPDQ